MIKIPALVLLFAVLGASQTSCIKQGKPGQDIHCLCPVPTAKVTISGSDGVNIKAIDANPKPKEWGCYQSKKQAICSFVSQEKQARFTLLVSGYKPKALSLKITEGRDDSVCACGWMKADPSQVELEKPTKD